MAKPVKPIPDGYGAVTPYLIVKGAAEAIEFYKSAFGARELMRMEGEGRRIGHAEIIVGTSPVMLADEHPERGIYGPRHFGGSPVHLLIYVEDVDAVIKHAVERGSTMEQPIQDQFYGDRSGSIRDPWGHKWTVATHKEDVPPEEMKRRMAALSA
jgi:PhnB protein